MKKARFGRLSILFMLMATLLCCAVFAISGLYFNDSKGGTASLQPDATIESPEVHTSAASLYGIAQQWSAAVRESIAENENYSVSLSADWTAQDSRDGYSGFYDENADGFESGALVVPAGADIDLDLNGYTIDGSGFCQPVIIVRGTLWISGPGVSGAGTIKAFGSPFSEDNPCIIKVENGGELYLNGVNIVADCDEDLLEVCRGIDVDNGTLVAYDSLIAGGRGYNGSGVYLTNGSKFTMTDTIISDNGSAGSTYTTVFYGGGVYVDATSTFTMHSGEISDNNICPGGQGCAGGGVYNLGAFTMNGGSISNNISAGYGVSGIGVYNGSNATFTMNGGEICGNRSSGTSYGLSGGGVFNGGTFDMYDGKISNNSISASSSGNGGGVYNSSNATFTMYNGEISNNNSTCSTTSKQYYGGGGVYNSTRAFFTMKDGKISNNTASGPFAGGAGVNNLGNFTMENGEISDNKFSASEGHGGGVYSSGTFIMQNGTISGTKMPNGGASLYGAGVYVSGGTFTMNSGEISNHTVTGIADIKGTVYISGESTIATISGGSISNNDIQGPGAGIYLASGTATLGGTAEISGNTANYYLNGNTRSGAMGGGVYVAGGTFNMEGSATITDNTANYGGNVAQYGGEFNFKAGSITNGHLTFMLYTSLRGSAVFLSAGTFTMSGTAEISGNDGLYEGVLGAVCLNAGTFDMTGGIICGNKSESGGAICQYGGTVNVSGNAVITDNYAEAYGGGVYLSTGTFNMTGGEVSENYAAYGGTSNRSGGGGFNVGENGILNITGGIVADNTLNGNAGGGIHNKGTLTIGGTAEITGNYIITDKVAHGNGVYNLGTFTMTGGLISNNSSSGTTNYGGGVFNLGTFDMTGGTISDHEATEGGGVYTQESFTVSGTAEIRGNKAETYGGGVYADISFDMTGGKIDGNEAETGAGVYVYGVFNFSGGEISNNTAYFDADLDSGNDGFGGGVYGELASEVTVSGNARLDSNTAYSGGGIYTNGTITLTGGRIVGNQAKRGAGIMSESNISIQGNPYVSGNVNSVSGAASNLTLYEGDKIEVTGLISAARIGVTGNGVITNNFTTAGNSAAAVNNFSSDIDGVNLVVNNGEIEMNIDLEKLWNDAVTASSETNQVIFNLPCDWTADSNGSFGTGIGFKNGAIYLPAGKNILFVSNGYEVNRKLTGRTPDGSVFIIEGRLEFANDNITIRGGDAEKGGSILVKAGGELLGGGKTSHSTAEYGGGIYVEAGATVSGDWEIRITTASRNGGGVYVEGGTVNFGKLKIVSATSTDEGAGIYVASGNVTVADIYATRCSTVVGGGCVALNGGTFTLNGGTIGSDNNTYYKNTALNGAGVLVRGGVFTMNGGEIALNESTESGGGVWMDGGEFNFNGGLILSNKAGIRGSAVYIDGGVFNIDGGEIKGNSCLSSANNITGTVAVVGGELNLRSGKIYGNEAHEGGAVYIDANGTFNMEGGEICTNVSAMGGAVFVVGTFNFSGGEIYGNTSKNLVTSEKRGLGVKVAGGTVNMSGSAEISSQRDAIFVESGVFNMNGGSIIGNRGSENNGGAIYVGANGAFIMTDGEIASNEPTMGKAGGAIYTEGIVEILGGSIHGNQSYVGGAITVGGGKLTMTGGEIYGNDGRQGAGGAIRIDGGAVEVLGGEIRDNTAMAPGGAIFMVTGSLTIGGTASVSGNSSTGDGANYGGGAIAVNGGDVIISGGTISNNTTAVQGGAIYQIAGTLTISGGVIEDNSAKYVGGVYATGIDYFEMSGGRISGHTSTNSNVSGLSISTVSGLISGGVISGNDGGAAIGGDVQITGGTFTDNGNDNSNYEGGLLVSGTVTMSGDATVTNNKSRYGAGIRIASGTFVMNGGTVSNNAAKFTGGGIFVASGASLEVNGGVISNNTANSGAGIYQNADNTRITVTGGRIINNVANVEGGGIYVEHSRRILQQGETAADYPTVFTMTGGEISGNTAADGAGVYVRSLSSSYPPTTVEMEGTPVITGNTLSNGSKSNLYVSGKGVQVINVLGKFLPGANIGVSSLGRFTYGLHHDNPEVLDYFVADATGAEIKIENYELTISVNLEQAWNAAVQESLDNNGAAVTFTLLEDWYATLDNDFETSFGANTGVGFKDGAIYVPAGAHIIFDLKSYTVNRNKPTQSADGSVIRVGGTLEITSNYSNLGDFGKIVGGNATNGGGVFVESGGHFTLTHGVIGSQTIKNSATSGGGVYVDAGATFVMGNGFIEYNFARSGAGVYVEDGMVELNAGEIRYNETPARGRGAGVYVHSGKLVTEYSSYIHDNSAYIEGGGIYVQNGEAEINARISNNTAGSLGGGIYVHGGNVTFSGNVSGNTADNGGGVWIDGGEFVMEGGHIDSNAINDAAFQGGGVCVGGGTFTMKNGTINMNATKQVGISSYSSTVERGAGVYVGSNGTFNMEGGEITNNCAKYEGGGVYVADGVFHMTGGRLYNNRTTSHRGTSTDNYEYGAGAVHVAGGEFIMDGGSLEENRSYHGAVVQIGSSATFTMNGGSILNSTTSSYGSSVTTQTQYGGGVSVFGSFVMNGGEISGINGGSSNSGGGVYVGSGASFEMNNGVISNNRTDSGAGVLVNSTATFTMNDGEISGNRATSSTGSGGGILTYGTTTINGGKISGNTAGRSAGGIMASGGTITVTGGEFSGNTASWYGGAIYIYNGTVGYISGGTFTGNSVTEYDGGAIYVYGTLTLTGGTFTGNSAARYGGGIGYETAINISGSPQIYGNFVNGEVNNTQVLDNNDIKLNITGALSDANGIAYIGFTAPNGRVFTNGFGQYMPNELPSTYFFSDNKDYSIQSNGSGSNLECVIGNKVTQVSLSWQYTDDNGTTWIAVDSPNASVEWTGSIYHVRAINGSTGAVVAFKSATDENGNAVTSLSDIGVYKFVIENELNGVEGVYLNPVLTFEITKAEVEWQYTTDGANWHDLDFASIEYTGLTYQFRAFYNGREVVKFSDPAKSANTYRYEVSSSLYSNNVLEFVIEKRNVRVEWNFAGSNKNNSGVNYWTYDGYAHAPVAYLTGIASEQAGLIDLDFTYTCLDRLGNTSTFAMAQARAGEYTVVVALRNADDANNIVLTNETVTFNIEAIALSLEWTDEDGVAGNAFNFDFDAKAHPLNAILSGVLAGDDVNLVISYVQGGRDVTEPLAVGTYTATAKLPAGCYNYYLDKTYTCQIVIGQAGVTVEWTGNSEKNGAFVWTYNGQAKAPTVKVVNPLDGSEIRNYTVEYAPVDANGTVGAYTTAKPADAGKYSMKISYTDGNFTLDNAVKEYEIEKLGVTLTWKGGEMKDGVIKWAYDGAAHDITPEVKGLEIWTANGIISTLEVERTDGLTGGLTSVGSATATAALKNTQFNKNFYILNSTSQDYEVYKRVIDSITWADGFGGSFGMTDTPQYDHGKVTGANGPAYTVTVPDYTAANGTLLLTVTYSASFTGAWTVDEVNGYKAYAKLSAADFANYEFADGTDTAEITFFVMEVSESKQNITVTWVVFVNAVDYVTVDAYVNNGGFVYNGNVQSPTPIWIKDAATGAYEILALNPNSIGADAKQYTARLMPSSIYNIPAGQFTCNYEIKPLSVEIRWQDGENDAGQTFSYMYDNTEKKPYAYAVDANNNRYAVQSVKGYVNAGNHTATAKVSDNFTIATGETQAYEITKLNLIDPTIVWTFDGASGNNTDGWSWIFDGAEHAPTAKITLSFGTLNLTVMGKTSVAGTHYAYAVLDGNDSMHANFTLTFSQPDMNRVQFKIVQISAGTVIWEDNDGNLSVDGANKLSLIYNGGLQAPKAYFMKDGNKVYLTVNGKMTNVGTYTAFVTGDFDFGVDASGNKIVPKCTYEIKPMELDVVWSDTTLTYNGKAQSPTANVPDANLEGGTVYTLVYGTDYTVSSFTVAGDYKAKIKFLNNNYTYKAGTGETDFTVAKIKLGATQVEWAANGALTDANGGWYWQYDTASHNPTLSLTATYELDGDAVTFVFGYRGATANAGSHTATAFVQSATWRGNDVTGNFAIDSAVESKDYEITAFEITVRWDFTGASGNATDGYYWNFDGVEHGPKAYYTDWTGVEKELTVYGKQTNVRTNPYKATVSAPANCKFATAAVTEQEFSIKQASIEVIWDFAAAGASGNATDGYYWTYDGANHAPKAYIKVTASDGTVSKGAELTVTGATANAGTHTAVAAESGGNYIITAGATQTFTINEKEVYVLWYGQNGNTTDSFEWTYTGSVIAPTAKLADANGNLILDENGNDITVQVTGGMTDASANVYTAQAVDSFANYKFANAQTSQHTFKVTPKSLADNGFEWTANGATVSADGLTFTYTFNENAQSPVPQCTGGIGFVSAIVKVEADGTRVPVTTVKDAGKYEITVQSNNNNYVVPDALKTVTVVIEACETEVVWSRDKITFNGSNQLPAAYYENANGKRISLTVADGNLEVYDENGNPVTSYKNAGKYVVKAKLTATDGNYKLKDSTVEFTFEIAKKSLPVTWNWNGFTDNAIPYDGTKHAPVGIPSFTGVAGSIPQITPYFVITDENGVALADNTKAVNAGTYTMTYKLRGADASNYELDNAEVTFTVKKASLTVVADDKEVTFGASAPAYSATFTGFIAADAGLEAGLKAADKLSQWLICNYTNATVPGEYAIAIDKQWLADELKNYEITATDGKLTVKPAPGVLVWKGDTANGINFTYSGQACVPQAYYYTDAAETNPHQLNVEVYATRADAEAGTNPVTAINAGTYYAKATGGDGTYTFTNVIQEFTVNKLQIVISVKDLTFTYGEVSQTNLSNLLAENAGWEYKGNKLPVDDLKIKLSLNDTSAYAGSFLNAATYEITGGWNVDNNADLANNYDVTFEYANGTSGKFEVKKAEITVNIAENDDGYNYVEDFITRGGIYHVKNLKDFITFLGNRDAQPTIKYSATPYKLGEGVDDGQWSTDIPFINAAGTWVVNYSIELANHETKEGKLLISLVSDEFRIVLNYNGVYTVVYGEELPADLAKALFEKGVVSVDENQSAYTNEDFLNHATAAIYDENGNPVSGRIPAGRYEIRFTLDNNTYRIDGSDTEKSFEVTKRNVDITWGDLQFKYDEAKHMPVITVSDWTDPSVTVTLTEGENTVTIGGETVKITVRIEGDLITEGGHSVTIKVESDNYTVAESDETRAVSIIGEGAGEIVEGGLPTWALWLVIAAAIVLLAIIIALIVIIKKRKAQGDDDGFYEDADEEA